MVLLIIASLKLLRAQCDTSSEKTLLSEKSQLIKISQLAGVVVKEIGKATVPETLF